jgi:hypothetical protein
VTHQPGALRALVPDAQPGSMIDLAEEMFSLCGGINRALSRAYQPQEEPVRDDACTCIGGAGAACASCQAEEASVRADERADAIAALAAKLPTDREWLAETLRCGGPVSEALAELALRLILMPGTYPDTGALRAALAEQARQDAPHLIDSAK